MIKNIFFDFDGVLLESVSVKTEAFRKLYEFAGKEVTDKVVEYHLAHGGVSRFDKIKYFHNHLLGQDISETEINEWANRFSELALEGVLNSAEINGAKAFLEKNYQKFKIWVITGTPTEEIIEIIEKKGWTKYFIDAFGSPNKKKYWTEKLISEHNLLRNETVFIGDAPTDKEAAEFSGLHFILRKYIDNEHLFNDYKGLVLSDLTELEEIINAI